MAEVIMVVAPTANHQAQLVDYILACRRTESIRRRRSITDRDPAEVDLALLTATKFSTSSCICQSCVFISEQAIEFGIWLGIWLLGYGHFESFGGLAKYARL